MRMAFYKNDFIQDWDFLKFAFVCIGIFLNYHITLLAFYIIGILHKKHYTQQTYHLTSISSKTFDRAGILPNGYFAICAHLITKPAFHLI